MYLQKIRNKHYDSKRLSSIYMFSVTLYLGSILQNSLCRNSTSNQTWSLVSSFQAKLRCYTLPGWVSLPSYLVDYCSLLMSEESDFVLVVECQFFQRGDHAADLRETLQSSPEDKDLVCPHTLSSL